MGEMIHNFIHSKSEAAILARSLFEVTVGYIGQSAVAIAALFPMTAEARVLIAGFISMLCTWGLSWLRKRTEAEVTDND